MPIFSCIDTVLCPIYNIFVPFTSLIGGTSMPNKDLRITIDSNMLFKLKVMSYREKQTVNHEILSFIEKAIKSYEEEHGTIEETQ